MKEKLQFYYREMRNVSTNLIDKVSQGAQTDQQSMQDDYVRLNSKSGSFDLNDDVGLNQDDLKSHNEQLQGRVQALEKQLLAHDKLKPFGDEELLLNTDMLQDRKDQLIVQLRDQLQHCESSFRVEVNNLVETFRKQNM